MDYQKLPLAKLYRRTNFKKLALKISLFELFDTTYNHPLAKFAVAARQ